MTALKKQDILKILTLIRANYDNAYASTSIEEAEMLINFWYDCLNKYSYETVYEATKNAISNSQFVPRLANIVNEAEKIVTADRKSDEELWAELTDKLYEVYDVSRYLPYPQHYKIASKKLDKIYISLSEDLKLYVVNVSTLIELSELQPENLVYEKARFFKQMPVLRAHAKDKQAAQVLLNGINSTPSLTDGKKKI